MTGCLQGGGLDAAPASPGHAKGSLRWALTSILCAEPLFSVSAQAAYTSGHSSYTDIAVCQNLTCRQEQVHGSERILTALKPEHPRQILTCACVRASACACIGCLHAAPSWMQWSINTAHRSASSVRKVKSSLCRSSSQWPHLQRVSPSLPGLSHRGPRWMQEQKTAAQHAGEVPTPV